MPRHLNSLGPMREDDVKLTRENVTAASRVMMPAYVIVFGAVGANYAFTGQDRLTASPALEYADQLMDLHAWGVLFLVLAGLMLGAMISQSRHVFEYALMVGFICNLIWTGVFVAAAFNSDASPTAWAWPLLACAACLASFRSLSRGEH